MQDSHSPDGDVGAGAPAAPSSSSSAPAPAPARASAPSPAPGRTDEWDFGSSAFTLKDWVNNQLAHKPGGESEEEHMSKLLVKLQLLMHQANDEVEAATDELVDNLPRAVREIQAVEGEARQLRSTMADVLHSLADIEQRNQSSVRFLGEIDRVKVRLDSCATTLSEVDSWNSRKSNIERSFLRHREQEFKLEDLGTIARDLGRMRISLQSMTKLPEFEERQRELKKLQAQLKTIAGPRLSQAIEAHDTKNLGLLVFIYESIDRAKDVMTEYFRACREVVEKMVRGFVLSPEWIEEAGQQHAVDRTREDAVRAFNIGFLDRWLPRLFHDLTMWICQECRWSLEVFPNDRLFVSNLLNDVLGHVMNKSHAELWIQEFTRSRGEERLDAVVSIFDICRDFVTSLYTALEEEQAESIRRSKRAAAQQKQLLEEHKQRIGKTNKKKKGRKAKKKEQKEKEKRAGDGGDDTQGPDDTSEETDDEDDDGDEEEDGDGDDGDLEAGQDEDGDEEEDDYANDPDEDSRSRSCSRSRSLSGSLRDRDDVDRDVRSPSLSQSSASASTGASGAAAPTSKDPPAVLILEGVDWSTGLVHPVLRCFWQYVNTYDKLEQMMLSSAVRHLSSIKCTTMSEAAYSVRQSYRKLLRMCRDATLRCMRFTCGIGTGRLRTALTKVLSSYISELRRMVDRLRTATRVQPKQKQSREEQTPRAQGFQIAQGVRDDDESDDSDDDAGASFSTGTQSTPSSERQAAASSFFRTGEADASGTGIVWDSFQGAFELLEVFQEFHDALGTFDESTSTQLYADVSSLQEQQHSLELRRNHDRDHDRTNERDIVRDRASSSARSAAGADRTSLGSGGRDSGSSSSGGGGGGGSTSVEMLQLDARAYGCFSVLDKMQGKGAEPLREVMAILSTASAASASGSRENDTRFLSTAHEMLAELLGRVDSLIYDTMSQPLLHELSGFHTWSVWNKAPEANMNDLPLPSFSVQYSRYMMRIAEHLLNLAEQLVPFLAKLAENAEEQQSTSQSSGSGGSGHALFYRPQFWLGRVANGLMAEMEQCILKLPRMSKEGQKQLNADLESLINVVLRFQDEVSPQILMIQQVMEAKTEEERASARAASLQAQVDATSRKALAALYDRIVAILSPLDR